MVILGSMSLGGNIVPVENLAESLQVAFDAGAKRILKRFEKGHRRPPHANPGRPGSHICGTRKGRHRVSG
jgi:hypothetical protein